MEILDRDTIATLAQHLGWPAISIHLPTHRTGAGVQQDPIRFKNLLRQAEDELRAGGMRQVEIDAVLRPANALLADADFWRGSGEGLAVFVAEDLFHAFRVDVVLPESVMVAERFAIRPVLGALHTGERFYILALSKKSVRLLEGTRGEVRELDLSGVPHSLAEALRFDDYERQVQFHSRTPAAAGRGRRSAVFHGHGGLPDVEKDNLSRYLREVNRGVHEFLRDDDAPLLLAGVDYLLAIYRESNSYPHLVETSIPGNPDELSAKELHAEAYDLLSPHLRAEVERDMAVLDELSGTGGASTDLREIVPAAHEGRVRVLFVSPNVPGWGVWDPSSGRVDVRSEPLPGDWDLADLAAAETLLHGGTVHAVAEPPGTQAAAAIFRY